MSVGIFGTGRFGSFWASTLARRTSVRTYNRSDRPVPEGCEAVGIEELGQCECVMLCVAISAVEEATDLIVPHLAPGTVLMDTCSVKVYPMAAMLSRTPETTPVIGTHPMFGPDSAGKGVTDLPLVYAPARASDEVSARWRRFFEGLGLRVLTMTPDEHDREAAMTQGVTHFVGRVLADMQLDPSSIATVGYRKLLEVVEQTCNDPYQLFVDLQHYNPYTSQMRGRLQESLARMMASLESS
ncbi:MAG TPA: prephenate dehydrogenase/arogenate dehydrogenase family protein [Spirochaetia bacterium]|nr:prephenate dehydrogenase/arogenate dehydrogenase family protein [Spirochaetia bacterium]